VRAILYLATGLLVAAVAVVATPAKADAAVVIAVLAATTVLTARAFRIAIRTSHQGVLIRNFWRSRFIPWSEVERIEVGSHTAPWTWGPAKTVFVVSEGRSFPAQATMRWRGTDRIVADLRREAERYGAPGSAA
jgi:hypothetical protein